MHSSRMRTGRSLTVCWSLLPGGGVCSWGVSARGGSGLGVCSGGGSAPGGGGMCLLWGGGIWSRGALVRGGGLKYSRKLHKN